MKSTYTTIMRQSSNIPEDHHFVPRFYLREFVNPDSVPANKLCVRSVKKEQPSRASPKSVAYEKNLHTIIRETGEKSVALEHSLAYAESKMAPVYKKVLQQRGGQGLSTQEKIIFAHFVGLMTVRTPQYFDDVKKATKLMREAIVSADEEGDVRSWTALHEHFDEPNKLFEMTTKESRKAFIESEDFQKYAHLRLIEGLAKKHAKTIYEDMRWFFFEARGGKEFCTCDDPVMRISKEGNLWRHGVGHDTKIFFPLSPHLCFFAERDWAADHTADSDVDKVNEKTIWQAHECIYSRNMDIGIDGFLAKRMGVEKLVPRKK